MNDESETCGGCLLFLPDDDGGGLAGKCKKLGYRRSMIQSPAGGNCFSSDATDALMQETILVASPAKSLADQVIDLTIERDYLMHLIGASLPYLESYVHDSDGVGRFVVSAFRKAIDGFDAR